MRELKDYFCTYQQSKALMSLDCQYRWLVARYENDNDNILVLLLRSQALDYFRELGYDFNPYKSTNQLMVNGGFNYIITTILDRYQSKLFFETYHEAESALIDKLIELEKEARNGK